MSNDIDQVITNLFFVHLVSIDLLRVFSHLIKMDCTYKINTYKLSLFEIIKITSRNMAFSIMCVYMEFEREDNYHWILERLKSLIMEILRLMSS